MFEQNVWRSFSNNLLRRWCVFIGPQHFFHLVTLDLEHFLFVDTSELACCEESVVASWSRLSLCHWLFNPHSHSPCDVLVCCWAPPTPLLRQGPDGSRREASVFVEEWGRRVWESHIVKRTIPFSILTRGCVRPHFLTPTPTQTPFIPFVLTL